MAQPLRSLLTGLPVEVVGEADRTVVQAQPLDRAGPDDMAFVLGKPNLATAARSTVGVLFVGRDDLPGLGPSPAGRTLVVSGDPKGHFFAALARLRPLRPRVPVGQSPHAYIHPNAQIGAGTNVHPGATISAGVVVGADCDIHPGVYVGPGCRIGDRVQLHPNVVVYHDVTIGDRVIIQAGSAIGADGFGYQTTNGRHERLPHFGGVRIEDDVEIGANTTVDRGVIGETVVGAGTKIDNNVVIAHNCRLGRHNLLVSQVGLAGSVTTGDHVVMAGQVGIADHVTIGAGTVLGAKAGVHKDIPAGQTFIGTPAGPVDDMFKSVMALQKLPQMRQTLKELERQVAAIKARLGSDDGARRDAA